MTERKVALLKAVVLVVIIAGLGFFSKLYPPFEGTWIANHLAGLFYVTEVCLVIYIVFPSHSSSIYALIAFFLTAIIEFFQLWDPSFLMSIRGTFIGQTILGSSFNWLDFPLYLGGALLGWALLRWIIKE
jgi:hypothetical protein